MAISTPEKPTGLAQLSTSLPLFLKPTAFMPVDLRVSVTYPKTLQTLPQAEALGPCLLPVPGGGGRTCLPSGQAAPRERVRIPASSSQAPGDSQVVTAAVSCQSLPLLWNALEWGLGASLPSQVLESDTDLNPGSAPSHLGPGHAPPACGALF